MVKDFAKGLIACATFGYNFAKRVNAYILVYVHTFFSVGNNHGFRFGVLNLFVAVVC